jgi:hypothetical protein
VSRHNWPSSGVQVIVSIIIHDRLCRFLATGPEVPGSVPGPTRFLRNNGSGTVFTQPREDD